MTRRFQWWSVVLLLALLFVTTNGLRGLSSQVVPENFFNPPSRVGSSSVQVEGHETRSPSRSRGGSRFNPKIIEGLETSTVSLSSSTTGSPGRVRNGRRGGSSRSVETSKSATYETTTVRNTRQGHDVKSTNSNDKKTRQFAAGPSSSEGRRASTSNSRKAASASPESPPAFDADLRKLSNDEPAGVSKDVKQESRRISLFRTRNGPTLRKVGNGTIPKIATPSEKENSDDRKIDVTPPSVFSGTTEVSRSRTGRKIQTTLSSRDLKIGLPASVRFGNSRQSTKKRLREESSSTSDDSSSFERPSDDVSTRKKPEIVTAGSESISIDVPLAGEIKSKSRSGDLPSSSLPEAESNSIAKARRSRARIRPNPDKSTETTTPGSRSSGRGSSRFTEIEQVDNSLEKIAESRVKVKRPGDGESKSRDSVKTEVRSRKRGKSEKSVETRSPAVAGEAEPRGRNSNPSGSSERHGRPSTTRTLISDDKSAQPEVRLRSRVKTKLVGSTQSPEIVSAVSEDLTVVLTTAETVRATSRISASTTTSTTTARPTRIREKAEITMETRTRNRLKTTVASPIIGKATREDFFNNGLGFRGRNLVEASTSVLSENSPITEAVTRGNPGWKKRPSHRDESVSTTTASSTTSTTIHASSVISNEIPTSREVSKVTTSSAIDNKSKSRGSKRLTSSSDKDTPRGATTFSKTSDRTKINGELDESDNYPADFKARLAQLKNPSAKDSTTRPILGEFLDKYTTRQTRSTYVSSDAKIPDEDVEISTTENSVTTIIPVVPVTIATLSVPPITETSNVWTTSFESGQLKKINTDPRYVARSKQKLESAAKLVLKNESRSDDVVAKIVDNEKSKKTVKSSSLPTFTKHAANAKNFELPKRPESHSRFNKSRKNEVKIETTTIGAILREEDSIVRTTVPHSSVRQEASKEDAASMKSQSGKSPILSRRAKELPRENSPTTRRSRVWITPHIDKNFEEVSRSKNPEDTSTTRPSSSSTTTKRSRAWNSAYIDKNWQEPTRKPVQIVESSKDKSVESFEKRTTILPTATTAKSLPSSSSDGRYARKKSEMFKPFEPVPKIGTTEQAPQAAKRREFRPRTATYRRHSEVPRVMVVNALPADKSSSSSSIGGIAITPKAPLKFHATLKESQSIAPQRSARQEPTVNVRIAGDNESTSASNVTSGIVGESNGNSGDSSSNIFNPTRSTFLLSSNATFLEQIRSTVAPLLGALGNRTPIFRGATRDTENSNLERRITPSGSPPRFSARYKGAELFVRRPNVLEPAGPLLGSSTAPFTPTENSGSAPPISIESPGEPKELTFYHALETVSISNELEQTDVRQQQSGRVTQVARDENATDIDINDTSNANNDTIETTTTTTTIPITPLPMNETTVESITMDVRPLTTTIETSLNLESTAVRDNATQSPEVFTVLPETTVASSTDTTAATTADNPTVIVGLDSENDISNTEVDPTSEVPTSTTLESTRSSTQSESTTEFPSSSDAMTLAMTFTPEITTETSTSTEVTTRAIATTEMTTVTSVVENATTIVDTTTESISSTTGMDFGTTVENIASTFAAESTTLGLETTTIAQATTEEATSTIATTIESASTEAERATIVPESTTPDPSNNFDVRSNFEVSMESGTSIAENATASTPESTTPGSTELPTTITASSESPNNQTTTLMESMNDEADNSTASVQSTSENDLGVTETPTMITTSESEPTTIATITETIVETLPETTVPPNSNRSIMDIIGSALGNNTSIPGVLDDSLLSRMMIRLMSLFSESARNTSSAQTIERSNGTESANPVSVDEVPQFLGGFLDNTDKNQTSDDASSSNNETETTEPSPITESNQPVTTLSMIPDQTESSPEVTDTRVTTPAAISTTRSNQNLLMETTLTTAISPITSPVAPGDATTIPINDVTNITTNQPTETTLITTESTVEQSDSRVESRMSPTGQMNVEDLVNITTGDNGITTNNVPETTVPMPETSPATTNLVPNSLADFQDATTAAAERTANEDGQANAPSGQTNVPETTLSPDPIMITTEASTTLSPTTTPSQRSTDPPPTNESPLPETTLPQSTAVTSETSLPTTSEAATVSLATVATTTPISTSTSTESSSVNTEMTTTMMANATSTMTSSTSVTRTTPVAPSIATTTTPLPTMATSRYIGRFGASRITPAPRFSVSSSTRTPLRDYLVYGIFPNKTIVRKRPEDNLIDARNVDSPYVIFGIFPDGKLVRKFPNGTVIPDPPSNPVEVVFSLSTSTTNRPRPVFIDNQQNNNGAYFYNQNAPIYNNRQSSIFAKLGLPQAGFPGQVDLGLSGNSIAPDADGPNFISSQSTGTKMSDSLLNQQMGTSQDSRSKISGASTTSLVGPPAIATPSNVNPQGGRIIQERERDEASRSREAGGQRSTVYIGQEKFINYWSGGNTVNNNSRLVSVKINSVASSLNEGRASNIGSQQQTSFDILPNSQVTAPPGFPWKDPLDQIFGITTESPIITASVASNMLPEDSNPSRSPIMSAPINPLVEVFSGSSVTSGSRLSDTSTSTVADASTTITTTSTPATTIVADPPTITTATQPPTTTTTTQAPTTTTEAPTTTTTTPAPTTTTTTTTPAPTTTTTTTTTQAPTTTTTQAPTTTTTTQAPTTTTPAPTTTSTTTTPAPTTTFATTTTPEAPTTSTTAASSTMTVQSTSATVNDANNPMTNGPGQTAFGTTFDDLAFLNSLLQQSNQRGSSTPKTLTEVEQLLANKILSLALGNPGPTRSPKAIQPSNASPNAINSYSSPGPSSQPIIIDLLAKTDRPTVKKVENVTWRPLATTTTSLPIVTTSATTPRPVETTAKSQPIETSSKPIPTTKTPAATVRPVVNIRPRGTTTTPAPQGFGASILQALFGRNPFGPSTTQKPLLIRKPVKTTARPFVKTTTTSEKPLEIRVTPRQTEIPRNLANRTSRPASSTTPKNPYANEDDARFLAALLKAAEETSTVKSRIVVDNAGKTSSSIDDEAFLRAILSGRASVKPAVNSAASDAAFLAALLKSQGIEPSTPANRLTEQLHSSGPYAATTRTSPIDSTRIATRKTTAAPTTIWSPSSTYPPPIFGNFANLGGASQGSGGQSANAAGDGGVGSQVFSAAIGATRAFSQFLGAAITGAAQQLQSFVRNGTRYGWLG